MARRAVTAFPHKEWGISGGALLVASPPAIVARGAKTTVSVAEPFPAA